MYCGAEGNRNVSGDDQEFLDQVETLSVRPADLEHLVTEAVAVGLRLAPDELSSLQRGQDAERGALRHPQQPTELAKRRPAKTLLNGNCRHVVVSVNALDFGLLARPRLQVDV